ncbi:MAG TPA: hypothetical protein VFP65_19040 [Anaeromyxobacteraceae bacterium]|nr:hypothetical protein [Anaeromyxobacteraceae bacterium]
MTRTLAFAAALLAIARTTAAQVPVPPAPIEEPATPAPPSPAADGGAAPGAPAAPPPAAEVLAVPPATSSAEPVPAVAAPPPATQQPAAAPAAAQPSKRPPIYTWGSIGSTFAYDATYVSLNLGVGMMWKYGLAPNAELSYAFGSEPSLWTLRPGVTWFLPLPMFQPYVGAFYTHWFVGQNLPDQNGVGGRAGFSLNRMVSLGVTYDHALGCTTNCNVWTPQISASLSM